jgi:hypothetical protein
MSFVSSVLLRPVVVLLVLASMPRMAPATDWYVDVQTGNNANNGSSPGTAWRNLSFAVQQLQPLGVGPQSIHVARGLYDAAHGEQFPLFMRPWIQIVGTQGSAGTVLDGGGTDLLHYEVGTVAQPSSFNADCRTDGLTLRNGNAAITVSTNWNPASPSFHDLRITSMGTGVRISTSGFGPHQAHPTFNGVVIDHCFIGISMLAQSTGAPPGSYTSATLTDCRIEDCTGRAIEMTASFQMSAGVELTRCRIVRNAGQAIVGPVGGGTGFVTLRASLVANNQLGGLAFQTQLGQCTIAESTFAHNGGIGVSAAVNAHLTLSDSILFGNANDLDAAGSILTASYSVSGDGDLNAQPNCSSANPTFVAPAAGDFRLAFGSPCVDSGDPAILPSVLDLGGHPRDVDGDLDTQARPDRGCFEFAPLVLESSGSIGTPVRFELWGPAGGTTTLYFSRHALGTPTSTPFGIFSLDPSNAILLTSPVAPGPPVAFQRPIPNDVAWIGKTFSFQARTTSTLAPSGSAYTNAISLTIVP